MGTLAQATAEFRVMLQAQKDEFYSRFGEPTHYRCVCAIPEADADGFRGAGLVDVHAESFESAIPLVATRLAQALGPRSTIDLVFSPRGRLWIRHVMSGEERWFTGDGGSVQPPG